VDEEFNCKDKDNNISIDGWMEVSRKYIIIYLSYLFYMISPFISFSNILEVNPKSIFFICLFITLKVYHLAKVFGRRGPIKL